MDFVTKVSSFCPAEGLEIKTLMCYNMLGIFKQTYI